MVAGQCSLQVLVVLCLVHICSTRFLGSEDKDYVRFVCLSDTHGYHRNMTIPDGDVLLHAGDIHGGHSYDEQKIQDFYQWFRGQPHPIKILVAGNHDSRLSKDKVRDGARILPPFNGTMNGTEEKGEAIYLQDNGTRIEGDVLVWGTPWESDDEQYETYMSKEDIKAKWALIPEDTVVLVSHAAPCGFDMDDGTYCDDALRDKIRDDLPNLQLVVFGHSHTPGRKRISNLTIINAINNVTLVNAAVDVDKGVENLNEPAVVDILRSLLQKGAKTDDQEQGEIDKNKEQEKEGEEANVVDEQEEAAEEKKEKTKLIDELGLPKRDAVVKMAQIAQEQMDDAVDDFLSDAAAATVKNHKESAKTDDRTETDPKEFETKFSQASFESLQR